MNLVQVNTLQIFFLFIKFSIFRSLQAFFLSQNLSFLKEYSKFHEIN